MAAKATAQRSIFSPANGLGMLIGVGGGVGAEGDTVGGAGRIPARLLGAGRIPGGDSEADRIGGGIGISAGPGGDDAPPPAAFAARGFALTLTISALPSGRNSA